MVRQADFRNLLPLTVALHWCLTVHILCFYKRIGSRFYKPGDCRRCIRKRSDVFLDCYVLDSVLDYHLRRKWHR